VRMVMIVIIVVRVVVVVRVTVRGIALIGNDAVVCPYRFQVSSSSFNVLIVFISWARHFNPSLHNI
jgi:hypothetical protein